jgi:hypothetical protein
MVFICIGKQKVIWILKHKENGWKAATSALSTCTFSMKLWNNGCEKKHISFLHSKEL